MNSGDVKPSDEEEEKTCQQIERSIGLGTLLLVEGGEDVAEMGISQRRRRRRGEWAAPTLATATAISASCSRSEGNCGDFDSPLNESSAFLNGRLENVVPALFVASAASRCCRLDEGWYGDSVRTAAPAASGQATPASTVAVE